MAKSLFLFWFCETQTQVSLTLAVSACFDIFQKTHVKCCFQYEISIEEIERFNPLFFMLIFHHFSVLGLKHRKKNAYIYIQFYIAGKVWGGVTQDGLRWGGVINILFLMLRSMFERKNMLKRLRLNKVNSF